MAIRADEIDNLWRTPATLDQEDEEQFPGEMFAKARPVINTTKLWKIVSRMPKGALLHAHLSAMQPFDVMLQALYDTEGMVIASTQPLDTEVARRNASITLAHVNSSTSEAEVVSLTSPEYISGSQVPVVEAAAAFPGGKDAFFSYLKSRLVLTEGETLRHDLGVDAVWRTFQALFGPSGGFVGYEPLLRTWYRNLLPGLVDDQLSWVEIRNGGSRLVPEGAEDPDPDLDFFWRVTVEEIERFQASEKGKDFWGVRFIWSDLRRLDRDVILQNMVYALERKLAFPDLIAGYDLVQQEDLRHPLVELLPELIFLQEQASALNLTLPFFFHAGETLGDGNSTDHNLFDAIMLDTRRIGHGFSLYKHPQLLKDVAEKRVLVEVCPISSEVLRLATDILHHPIYAMISHGVPTAISNDDAAMMGQDIAGVSYDFYQVLQGSDNVGLAGLVSTSAILNDGPLLDLQSKAIR